MANIVPKLNLNRTPNIVDNTSMVLAKNIRVDVDGTIHKDYSIESLQRVDDTFYDNLLDRIIADFKSQESSDESGVTTYYLTLITEALGQYTSLYHIRQIIPDNKSFYVLLTIAAKHIIVKFDEEDDLFHPCDCNWTYNKGTITGTVINNLLGETILVIAEKNDNDNIPLKCINLSKSSHNDDESIYTQTPKVPITNLIYTQDFKFSIPNGVYQFFIRYKIRDNFYTNWFPASKELFAGNKHITNTIFGTLGYHVSNINSDNSFIFVVQHLIRDNCKNFKSFQIGFIVSNDGSIKARAWKHFNFNTRQINFDYKSADAEEIEVTDLTKPIFNVYNVGNVTSFKNKLYIANYKETNFNEALQDCANKVKIDIKYKSTEDDTNNVIIYNNYVCILNEDNNIKGIYIDEYSTINNIIRTNLSDAILGAVIATNNYKNTINCVYYKSGASYNSSYKDTGIFLKCTRNTFNVKKPTKIILKDYDTNDVTSIDYNGSTEEEQNKDIKSAISGFNNRANDFYNIDYIDVKDYQFCSAGSNNDSNQFDNSNNLLRKNSAINAMCIRIAGDNYDAADINTYDDITIAPYIDTSLIYNDVVPITSNTTLIPYQTYRFYIHYVKETGEVTNGIFVKEVTIQNKDNTSNEVIYPIFDDITIPTNYAACFFSIVHTKNQTSTVYNIAEGNYGYDGNCFELNTRLFNFNNAPTLHKSTKDGTEDVTTEANYYNSSDITYARYFGAEGIIHFSNSHFNYSSDNVFIVNQYNNIDETNLELVKCTPYINTSKFINYNNYNLLGYICAIYPLNRNNTTKIYTDGSSIYKKQEDTSNASKLSFVEYNKYNESNNDWLGDLTISKTNITYIYSNFNLNYIELSDDLKPKYVSCYNSSESDTNNTAKPIIKFFNLVVSQSLFLVYKLDSTYYNYTRKVYSIYNNDDVYKFDNTIRASNLAGDEEKLSIFTFDADTYYNIPTNRGKIVNLISVGDAILVHTRDSMFKFTGSTTLQSSVGEIQQTETDVFKTGVSEVFGSDFGFAGLQNKTNAITTEAGYIFYDGDSKIIYMYSGNGQIVKLSDSIEKLFRYDTIKSLNFANDYYNNRFFVCIHFKNGDATLSYSFNEESKSFVSLHDFKFSRAFNTKTKCYFVNVSTVNTTHNICRIDKSSYGIYRHLNIQDKIYPYFGENITENYKDSKNEDKSVTTYKYDSIIDVIENTNYENIKTLNYLNWNCSIVNDEFPIYNNKSYFNALASSNEKYPCKTITIYTDTCATKNLDCSSISNDKKITDINTSPYYQYPRYNQGFWTLNYFRNVLNTNDEFKYLNNYNDGRKSSTYRSDNNSLIEGKYFVTRFTFNASKDFKFETITFNYDTKL